MSKKKIIVDEDTYESAISSIIERDFFPDIQILREERDSIDAAYTPSNSSVVETHSNIDKPHLPYEGESLDSYLGRTKSEDDAALAELIEKDQDRLREKYRWLSNNGNNEIDFKVPKSIIAEARNSLMYVPDTSEKQFYERSDIIYKNTRIEPQLIETLEQKAIEKRMIKEKDKIFNNISDKIGINGQSIIDTQTGLEYNLISSPAHTTAGQIIPFLSPGSKSKTMAEFPTPNHTPRTNCPGFRMKAASKREQIGLKLSEDASKQKRNRKKKALIEAMSNLTPHMRKNLYNRGTYLSPAAKSLLHNSLSSHRAADSIGLRSSYTPTFISSVKEVNKQFGDTPSIINTPSSIK